MAADGLADEGVFRADMLVQGIKQVNCRTFEEISQHFQYTEYQMNDPGTLRVGMNHITHSFKPVPLRR